MRTLNDVDVEPRSPITLGKKNSVSVCIKM